PPSRFLAVGLRYALAKASSSQSACSSAPSHTASPTGKRRGTFLPDRRRRYAKCANGPPPDRTPFSNPSANRKECGTLGPPLRTAATVCSGLVVAALPVSLHHLDRVPPELDRSLPTEQLQQDEHPFVRTQGAEQTNLIV